MSKRCTLAHLQSIVDENLELGFPRDEAAREAIEQLVLSGFDVHQQLIDAVTAPLESPRESPRPSQLAIPTQPSDGGDQTSSSGLSASSPPTSPAQRIAAHIQAERTQRLERTNSDILDRLEQARVDLLGRIESGEADPQLLKALDHQLTRAIDNELQRPNSRSSRPNSAATSRSSCSKHSAAQHKPAEESGKPLKNHSRRPRSTVPKMSRTASNASEVLSSPVDTSDLAQAQARAIARAQNYRQIKRSYKVPGRKYSQIDPAMRPVRVEPVEKPDVKPALEEGARRKPPKMKRGPVIECAPPPPAAVRRVVPEVQTPDLTLFAAPVAGRPSSQVPQEAQQEPEMDLDELQRMVMAKRQELMNLGHEFAPDEF